jgi:hypothetical protein
MSRIFSPGLAAVEDGVQPAGVVDFHRSIPAAPRQAATGGVDRSSRGLGGVQDPEVGQDRAGLLGEDPADALADKFGR